MGSGHRTTAIDAALALGIFLLASGHFGITSPAMAQAAAKADALAAYNNAVSEFKAILAERRGQISAKRLAELAGTGALSCAQQCHRARTRISPTPLPSKIGRPNKFGIPPAYFDADNEPLIDEYRKLFDLMQAAPANAQDSATPFKDVVDLGTAIARAKGLDAANAEVAGRISLGLFFAETNGNQNIGNARSNTYKGSFQTGPSEDQNGRKKWAAIRQSIAAFDPATDRARRQGRGAGRRLGSPLQSLDRGAGRPDERPCRAVPADTGDRENAARSDRSDEVLRADPDRSQPDKVRNEVRQLARPTGSPTRPS